STVHYSGWAGWLGIFVYVWLAWRGLAWGQFRTRLLSAVLGGCVAGLPYLILHVLRNWDYLPSLALSQPKRSQAETLQGNFPVYRDMRAQFDWWPMPDLFYAAPLKAALRFGIPPFAVATTLLAWRRCTRAVAVASLPVPVFLFFLFSCKLYPYYYLESSLVLISCWVLVAALWWRLATVIRRPWSKAAGAVT